MIDFDEPTKWVSSLVIIEKPDKRVRVCLDPKDLNRAICREHLLIPTAEEIFSLMHGAKYFSKLDASSGYWQVMVDEESSKLLTFNTPFRRYRFIRLPFGIKSASEVFQCVVNNVLEGLSGIFGYQDDIIIWGKTVDEHNERLEQTLNAVMKAGMKLNLKKCEILKEEITFLGHLLTSEGIKPDPQKVTAIRDMSLKIKKFFSDCWECLIIYVNSFQIILKSHIP